MALWYYGIMDALWYYELCLLDIVDIYGVALYMYLFMHSKITV